MNKSNTNPSLAYLFNMNFSLLYCFLLDEIFLHVKKQSAVIPHFAFFQVCYDYRRIKPQTDDVARNNGLFHVL